MDINTVQDSLRPLNGSSRHSPGEDPDYDLKRDALELVRIYLRIGDRRLRRHFVSLVRAIARLNEERVSLLSKVRPSANGMVPALLLPTLGKPAHRWR